ncbi:MULTISPECIES: hypothetical protein [unclassified Streptomyces]|uniref:hypothetical protein n=1 Tax=unclassified Streptomyces TaxID=2593676 RepID=UPI0022533C8C|nr:MULTISPECIES: hypothetical protein [unclassified Streptomyces]MCX4527310.1 hypothetical protein [Streptomyces sp. NBC_01551]MCX4542110.1 hypothetical protein [Streptomyces sp. NBC_01565]
MTAIEQYLIDTYRASQHASPMPPLPGEKDVATLRAARAYVQFQAVLDERPARHPWLAAFRRALRRPRAC